MIMTLAQANELLAEKDALIAELTAQKDAHIQKLTEKLISTQRQLSILQHQMEQMLRRLYGRKSEQLNPNQLMFDNIVIEAIEQNRKDASPEAPLETSIRKTAATRTHHGRVPIPEHLERVEILLDVPEEEKINPETGEPLKVIGVEVSEKLEYRPGKLVVNVYKRPQYGMPEGAGVVSAPMPDHPIAKCKADAGLLAYIIVSKFADHMPLYRQDGIFEREGVTIPRATQSSWLMQTYEGIQIMEQVLRGALGESDVIFTDDTVTPLQDKGNGKVKKARMWVYVRGGVGPPLTVYDFSIDRSKRRPLEFLDHWCPNVIEEHPLKSLNSKGFQSYFDLSISNFFKNQTMNNQILRTINIHFLQTLGH